MSGQNVTDDATGPSLANMAGTQDFASPINNEFGPHVAVNVSQQHEHGRSTFDLLNCSTILSMSYKCMQVLPFVGAASNTSRLKKAHLGAIKIVTTMAWTKFCGWLMSREFQSSAQVTTGRVTTSFPFLMHANVTTCRCPTWTTITFLQPLPSCHIYNL